MASILRKEAIDMAKATNIEDRLVFMHGDSAVREPHEQNLTIVTKSWNDIGTFCSSARGLCQGRYLSVSDYWSARLGGTLVLSYSCKKNMLT